MTKLLVAMIALLAASSYGENRDPLAHLQWALDSHGKQMVLSKGTNTDSEYIHSHPDSDLGIKNVITQWEANITKNLVIAVVDFGLDYNHPDIVDSIAYNSAECDRNGPLYKNPFRPKEDRDGNGHKGDCLGWSFVDEDNQQGHNDPMDDVGHGTHLAGIIAAKKNNGLGISGVSNRLKILPIKVMHRKQNISSDSKGNSFTDKVAQGILYAIDRKVDVINLSLGWPSSLDHQHIRQAIAKAIQEGIIVVAAAGNNKHSRPIAPCSYPGVLCVGSSRADKKISHFSNFGAHVDLVAPGDHILGPFPLAAHNRDRANIFNVLGYEIKSGTSQAAAYTSAVAALLKGVLGIGADEVKGRIFASAQPLPSDEGQYFRDGLIHGEKAYSLSPRPVLRPELKNLELIRVNAHNGKFTFTLTVKNYWARSEKFKIQVRSLSQGVAVESSSFELPPLSPSSSHVITISGAAINNLVSHLAKLSITITHQGKERSWPFEFILAQQLSEQPHLYEIPLELDDEIKQSLIKSLDLNAVSSPLRTITDLYRQSPIAEYYFASKAAGGVQLKILQRQKNRYRITKEVFIPRDQLLLSFHRHDFQRDGVAEYILRTGHENEQGQAIVHYTFLDHQFNPYYGSKHSTWKREEKDHHLLLFQQKLDKLQFLAFTPPVSSSWSRKTIWVPTFVERSHLPQVDQNPSFFAFAKKIKIPRLNFLIPQVSPSGEVLIRHRVFDHYQRQQLLTQQLNLSWKQKLHFLSLLTAQKGQSLRMLIRIMEKETAGYYILGLQGKTLPTDKEWDFINYQLDPLHTKEHFNLEFNQVYSSIKIDNSRPSYRFYHSDIFFAPFSEHMARIALFDSSSLSLNKKSVIVQKNLQENIHRFVQSFEMDGNLYTFLESNNFLTLLKTQGYDQTQISTAPLARFSFVPGYVAWENVQPIVVRMNNTWKPALYVDSSPITSQYIYSWIFDGNRLIAPLKLSLSLPPGCRGRDISPWGKGRGFCLCSSLLLS